MGYLVCVCVCVLCNKVCGEWINDVVSVIFRNSSYCEAGVYIDIVERIRNEIVLFCDFFRSLSCDNGFLGQHRGVVIRKLIKV